MTIVIWCYLNIKFELKRLKSALQLQEFHSKPGSNASFLLTHKSPKSCFLQLRNFTKVYTFFLFPSQAAFEKVIHATISSCLDYCNSLNSGLSQRFISRPQLVQNSAARFLTKSKRPDYITPILATLHWLPVRYWIDFKNLFITFKALPRLAPTYIRFQQTLWTKLLVMLFRSEPPNPPYSLRHFLISSQSVELFTRGTYQNQYIQF